MWQTQGRGECLTLEEWRGRVAGVEEGIGREVGCGASGALAGIGALAFVRSCRA